MRRTLTALAALGFLVLTGALLPSLSPAQAAHLYGYEKAPWVKGTVTLSAEKGEVTVQGFASHYGETLTLMAAKRFDPRGAVKVGDLPAGFSGDTSFPLPAGTAGFDTVIVLIPSNQQIPVGLGLVR